jgi:amino acid permease
MLKIICWGGTIGAALFVGSGEALINGGPASFVVYYTIVGFLMLCTMMSLGESQLLGVLLPPLRQFRVCSVQCPTAPGTFYS